MSTYICNGLIALLGIVFVVGSPLRGDVKNWQTGETILGTEGITPGPGIDLSRRHRNSRNLRFADFSGSLDLASALFYDSWLENARFTQANLAGASFIFSRLTNADFGQANLAAADLNFATMTSADLNDAVVQGASFAHTTARGFTEDQLYSTASYQQRNLQGIGLYDNDLSGWDFADQDLTSAALYQTVFTGSNLSGANLTGANLMGSDLINTDLRRSNLTNADLNQATLADANLTGAVVSGTDFGDTTSNGFMPEQLYSTGSYQQRNLRGIRLNENDLGGWDFTAQDLTNAALNESTLTGVNLAQTVVTGASFGDTTSKGFTQEQLYSTASYRERNLQRIGLGENDLSGWDFAGQNLTDAVLHESTLTGANLTRAAVKGTDFGDTTSRGFTQEQLYSTASYEERDLQAIGLDHNDLTGWDFTGQDLSNADLAHARLTGANFTGAVIRGTRLCDIPGLTKEQLYSTASYQQRNLQGVGLYDNNMSGWDFVDQDLTNAILCCSILTNANFTGANLKGADFHNVSLDSTVFNPQTVYNQWTIFPEGFDPQAAGLTLVASPAGDFDASDVLDAADIDLLARRIREEGVVAFPVLFWQFELFDLDMNSAIDAEDHRIWVHDLKKTWFGDANLDGLFDNVDLVSLLQAGEYNDGRYRNSSWATGDWNGDGEFDRADLFLALQDGGYAQGPRASLAAVPEPATLALLLMGMVLGGGFLPQGGCGSRAVAFGSLNN